MKHVITAISSTIILILISSFTHSDNKLIGKWKNDNDGSVTYYTFDKEGYATIENNEIAIGGRSSISNGVKFKMTYVVNYETTPIELDIISTDLSTGAEITRMKGIVEFISADKIKMLLGTESRPTEFIDSDAYVFTLVQ